MIKRGKNKPKSNLMVEDAVKMNRTGISLMRKLLMFLTAWAFALGLLLGCAGPSQETSGGKEEIVRCPKCGGFFSTKEGAQLFRENLPQ